MKITIDTTLKTVTIQDEIILCELLKELEMMLPDFKEYKLIETPAISPLNIQPVWPSPTTVPFHSNTWFYRDDDQFRVFYAGTSISPSYSPYTTLN